MLAKLAKTCLLLPSCYAILYMHFMQAMDATKERCSPLQAIRVTA